MTTDELIVQISHASHAGDWAGVQQYLGQLKKVMAEQGRPINSPNAYRLVEALSDCAPLMRQGPDPYALVRKITAHAATTPPNIAEMRSSWDLLYAMLADHEVRLASPDVRTVLETFRNVRSFDLVTRLADRALMRDAGDARVRNVYAQSLIETGQTFAAIPMLESVKALPNVAKRDIDETHGLLGRANKQIYIDNVKSPSTPLATRLQFKPYLERAITEYAAVYDPSRPAENYWQGAQVAALLALAAEDGFANIKNPTGLSTETLSRKIIDALAPSAENNPDAWVSNTVGQCYLALKDYENAAKYYGIFARHRPMQDFVLMGTVRQLEQIWRIKPDTPGAGSLLAILKAEQVHQVEGAFTLPSRQLGTLRELAGSPHTESMVEDGDFLKLKELRDAVQRAGGVVAVKSPMGDTMGTGFLFKGKDLSDRLDNAVYLMTNAHVMTEKNKEGAEPGTLDPQTVRLKLEALDLELSCEPVTSWQSPIVKHDTSIVKITSSIGDAATLPFAKETLPLDIEDPALARTGTRVSIIGHPKGGDLSLSIVKSLSGAKGLLVDMGPRKPDEADPVYLHYRAPTERGNSGSPVFEAGGWNVIGLHHMGFDQFEGRHKLNGKTGMHHANEGICIKSIRRAVDKDLAPQKAQTGKWGLMKKAT